jgi:hypothetical protein
MWPFRRRKSPAGHTGAPQQISFSQVDTTARFGDRQSLGPDDWIETEPLNRLVPDPESMGLPAAGATDEDTYRIADRLSSLRERIPVVDDGVYCPICHIANTRLDRLRQPCPECGRELLKFGWE